MHTSFQKDMKLSIKIMEENNAKPKQKTVSTHTYICFKKNTYLYRAKDYVVKSKKHSKLILREDNSPSWLLGQPNQLLFLKKYLISF